MKTTDNYSGNIYSITSALVIRDFLQKGADGKWVADSKIQKTVLKHANEVKKSELAKCPYCLTEVVPHVDGNLVPPHFEHKSKEEAIKNRCSALLKVS